MTLRFNRWRAGAGRAVPLALAFALIAAPVAASEAAPPATARAGSSSLRQAAAREASRTSLKTLKTTTGARRAEQTSTAKQSTTFFKTAPGMIALAVMAVGTGYAFYSWQHDRVTSPAKK